MFKIMHNWEGGERMEDVFSSLFYAVKKKLLGTHKEPVRRPGVIYNKLL